MPFARHERDGVRQARVLVRGALATGQGVTALMRDIKSTREWAYLNVGLVAMTPWILLLGIPSLSVAWRLAGAIYLGVWLAAIFLLARMTVRRFRELRQLDQDLYGLQPVDHRNRRPPSHPS